MAWSSVSVDIIVRHKRPIEIERARVTGKNASFPHELAQSRQLISVLFIYLWPRSTPARRGDTKGALASVRLPPSSSTPSCPDLMRLLIVELALVRATVGFPPLSAKPRRKRRKMIIEFGF